MTDDELVRWVQDWTPPAEPFWLYGENGHVLVTDPALFAAVVRADLTGPAPAGTKRNQPRAAALRVARRLWEMFGPDAGA